MLQPDGKGPYTTRTKVGSWVRGPRWLARGQATGCVRQRCLGDGLHGTQAAAASRVLLLLDNGDGRVRVGRLLIDIRATDLFLFLHGATTHALTTHAFARTRGAVRRVVVNDIDDAHAAMLPDVPAWSNSPLLRELAWSGELLNHASAWGDNLLRRARQGPRSYEPGSAGHPVGVYAGELLFLLGRMPSKEWRKLWKEKMGSGGVVRFLPGV